VLAGQLSPRLRQVLEMLLRGSDEKRIAWDLGRSRHTVHNHVRRLYRCMGVKSRAELMAVARPVANFRPRVG
jgi:DNA-binding NarL/FixJ family response regulator